MAFRKSNLYLSLVNSYVIDSPQPSSINYWWNLGSLLGLCLVIQICTGIFLAMHYSSNIELAFSSVEHIMRDVQHGYLIRYMHANGASFFFICMYIHIGKGLYYGSYRSPRIVLWTVGVVIFVLTMAAAFLGYKNYNNSPKLYKHDNNNKLNIIIQKRYYSKDNNYKKYNISIIKIYSLHSGPSPSFAGGSLQKKNYPTTDKSINEVLEELNIKLLKSWDNLENNLVRNNISNTVKNKAGIYIIINKINNKFYIGSSINKLYNRFCRHLLNFNGNKLLEKAVKLYGLNNFIFGIIEFKELNYEEHEIIIEELCFLETLYILTLVPKYNILTETYSNKNYKHLLLSIEKIKNSFTVERRKLLNKLQSDIKGKWPEERKNKLSDKNSSVPLWGAEQWNSQIISLYNENHLLLCNFKNITLASHYLCTSEKTILRCLNKGIIYVPTIFLPYLNNKFLSKNNYIKSFINKNELLYINKRIKLSQKKSGNIPFSWNTKLFILNK